ncbi:MAG: glycoside hydrolase family 31 protein [Kiritimatiellia bacterium]
MNLRQSLFTCSLAGLLVFPALAGTVSVKMAPGENWWGAANFFGTKMPFTERTDIEIDLRRDNYHNQCASFLASDQGRVIWTDAQARFTLKNGVITMEADAEISVEKGGASLPEAYRHAMRKWFPASGKMLDPLFFNAPQINTWIELTYHQNERDILAYAKSMLDNGVPAGVLMIDDTWQAGYGDWRFEPTRFRDPKGMMERLHAMGYKVMLWMCPYVGMDLPAFRRIAWGVNPDDVRGYPVKGGFLAEAGRRPAANGRVEAKACRWWNGYSAFLDFSHPNANAWFTEVLDGLVRDYGVDGFKLDGADLAAYDLKTCAALDPKATNGSLNNGYAAYALKYPFCEIRNLWRMQQMPVVVRLHDKPHTYEALRRITADMIAAGLIGQPFICPDMVGGGEWTTFIPGSPFDPDLFVRSAQIHALCPMMQFSASPWRVLDAERQRIVRDTVALRQKFAPQIVALAKKAAVDGEPILRSLEYNYPNQGYAAVIDQFMMGTDLLVAPQMEKGAATRTVVVPPGTWRADDGSIVTGPATITVQTPLARLPHFVRTR